LIASLLWGAYVSHKLDLYLHPTSAETATSKTGALKNPTSTIPTLSDTRVPPSVPSNKSKSVLTKSKAIEADQSPETAQQATALAEPPNTQHASPEQSTEAPSWKPLLSILAVAGVSTLPLGYLIGVLSISIFRLAGCITFGHWNWEIPTSSGTMNSIMETLKITDSKKKAKYQLQAAAIFDHVLTRPQVHSWILRRWNSFLISSQCATALLLSLCIGPVFGVPLAPGWWMTSLVLCGFFIWNAVVSWEQARDMFSVAVEVEQARRPPSAPLAER
jgi:hypothetical protein